MKKKIISLAATFALASVVCSGVALNAASAKATVASNASVSTTVQSGEWTITGLDGEKTYGTSVAMPTATVTDGGKQITAKAYVCLPNGSNVSGETFTLSQAGTYTVCFYAQDGEKLYKTERTFVVDAPFVSVGENSSAEYGTYTGCGSTTNNKGFLLRIAEGEEVTFNKLIDISALSSSDTLFSAFVTPDQEGVPDFDRVIFTLTDAVDPTCTLTIAGDRVARDTWLGSEGVTYFKAAGENQSLTGIESFGTVNEKVHVNSEWGCGISHSFCAQRINEAGNALTTMIPSNNPIKMRYDKDGQTLVVNGNTMADLDNAKYSKSLWHGFPSGKAKLSVSASGYNGKTANLCVTEIFGLDFAETTVEDVTAPEITVNAAYDAMPIGEVGCNYPLPDATAVDDYIGICEVTRRVVYNYGEVGAVTVPVVDGKIRADYIGTYTIIYSAEDYYGNASESFLTFNIAKDVEDIAIALPEYDESYYCGGFVKIQDAVLSGGVGNLTCKTRVYYGDKEVSVEKNTFKVSGAGEWKIVYEVTDYTGATKTATATFNGVAADGAMFVERPVLPKVLIGGCDYVFENYYAELYTNSGMSHVLCSLKVTDKNGTKTLNAGDTYVPNVEKSGDTVMVVFVANGVESDAYEIPVANVRTGNADDGYSIDMTQYLLGEGLKKTAKSLEIEVEAEEDGDLSWTFANALLHGNFSLELNAIPEKDLFSGLQITLTDAYDASRAVSVILEKKSGKTRLRAGKNTAELTTVGFECKEKSSIVLSYANGAFSVGNASVVVAYTDAGDAFEGFLRDKVYLTVTALEAEVGAQYAVSAVSLNRMNTNTEDYSDPAIVISGTYGGSYDWGSIYSIPKTYAADVLAPHCEVSLTVYTPSNGIATDVNGVRLDKVDASAEWQIKLSEYGQYRIRYTASESDWFGNEKSLQYMVSVYDNVAPEIVLGNYSRTGTVGEVYRLPKRTISDNLTTEENIASYVYVYTPNGKLVSVTDSVLFETAGDYEFRVTAIDEAGNVSYKTFTVRVSEKEVNDDEKN